MSLPVSLSPLPRVTMGLLRSLFFRFHWIYFWPPVDDQFWVAYLFISLLSLFAPA